MRDIKPLLDNKISAFSTLKAIADKKFNINPIIKYVFHMVKYIVEKGEKAGYKHFLLFPQCFQKSLSKGH